MNNNDILELDDAYVLNYYDKNGKYGEALAIDAFSDPNDPEGVENKIDKWLKDNGDEHGTSKLEVRTEKYSGKDYIAFYFKITTQTKIVDLDGKKLSKDELVRGANVGLVARAVPYEYEGRSGIMRLLETVVVYEPKRRTQTNLDRIRKMREERMARAQSNTDDSVDKPTVTNKKEHSDSKSGVVANTSIESERIPF